MGQTLHEEEQARPMPSIHLLTRGISFDVGSEQVVNPTTVRVVRAYKGTLPCEVAFESYSSNVRERELKTIIHLCPLDDKAQVEVTISRSRGPVYAGRESFIVPMTSQLSSLLRYLQATEIAQHTQAYIVNRRTLFDPKYREEIILNREEVALSVHEKQAHAIYFREGGQLTAQQFKRLIDYRPDAKALKDVDSYLASHDNAALDPRAVVTLAGFRLLFNDNSLATYLWLLQAVQDFIRIWPKIEPLIKRGKVVSTINQAQDMTISQEHLTASNPIPKDEPKTHWWEKLIDRYPSSTSSFS